jgi:aerobic-type carbon monoxide dehydrogenase small subunit (CoxS/CutS family)
VRSCLMFAVQAQGVQITTVEGLADGDTLSDLQKAFHDNFALQCGFCTPGFLTTAESVLAENPSPTRAEVQSAISGNICRCTGYVPIIDAILDTAKRRREGGQ